MIAPIKIAQLPGDFVQTTLDKLYTLDGVLTEDSTGTIFATKTKIRGRTVALNVLAPDCRVVSRKLIRMEHPNICKAHKVLTLKDGTVVVVIDKPDGRPILEFMADDESYLGFNAGRAISAVMQLLSALHTVHSAKKTARNLTVNNVFVHRDAHGNLRLKLISIGIGGTGVNMKAPHYYSPERIMNIDKGDARADIWAAGAVMYHLCYGRPPFSGSSDAEVAKKNMLETPDFDPGAREIPSALVEVIKRALDRDENKRYQTVSEMIGDLLPLRETYNEPMSDDVSTALKKSYPPPPVPPKGKLAPKKPAKPASPGLHPGGPQTKSDTNETTAEYGIEGKPPQKKVTFGKFLGVDFSANKKDTKPKKSGAGASRVELSKTLMGIPAFRVEQTESPDTAPKLDEASSALLSARSILGSDEDIKQLEAEMDFLEDRKDEEVPTLVLGEENFAALAGKQNADKKPAPSVSTTDPGNALGNIAETAPAPPPYGESTPLSSEVALLRKIQLRARLGRLSLRRLQALKNHKWVLVGIAAALITVVSLAIVLLPRKPAALRAEVPITVSKPSPAATSATAGKPKPPPDKTRARAVVPNTATQITEVEVSPAEITPMPAPEPQDEAPGKPPQAAFVHIRFPNIPKNSRIKVDGKLTELPVRLAESKTLATISIFAEGFAPYKVKVVPDRDRELLVRLTPKRHTTKREKKSSGSKPKTNTGNLVSNPFRK